MPFAQGNQFGSTSYRASKTFSERYRWTEEEKLAVLDELQHDITITPKIPTGFISVDGVAETDERFGKMGHYSSGFTSLDNLCLGFDQGEYVVLGAGTNQGKTQLATYIAKAQAAAGVPTLYVSRELSNVEMRGRFTHIGAGNLKNLWVPDSNRLNPNELLELIKRFREAHDRAFVIVDHLHAFYRGDNLTEVLGAFSAGLRELAQDLHITILALSQFNRQPYKDDEGPMNYHLKESGYIADDAYTILLGWRTREGLHVKLTKTRRLDLGDVANPIVTLTAGHGLLKESSLNVQESLL